MCSSYCDIEQRPLFDIETGERHNLYRIDTVGNAVLLYSFRTQRVAEYALENYNKRRSGTFIYRKEAKA